MDDTDRLRLVHGPYRPPRCQVPSTSAGECLGCWTAGAGGRDEAGTVQAGLGKGRLG
jgi:hypothetical protein